MARRLAVFLALALLSCAGDDGRSGPDGGDGGAFDGGDGGRDGAPLPEIGPCGTTSPGALVACIDRARLAADIEAVAVPREPGSAGWATAQALCASRLEEVGLSVELQDYGTGVNVVGTLEGDERGDERVVLSAHYDHIPGCPGADDNATGVAAALESARLLAGRSWPRTLEVVCADEEETGHLGSNAHAAAALESDRPIVAVYVIDSIGVTSEEPGSQELPAGIDLLFPDLADELEENEFRADFFVVLADDLAHEPATLVERFSEALGRRSGLMELEAEIKNDPLLAELRRADHASYWAVDIPALLVTDTTELRDPCYHCGSCPDTPDRLDLDFAVDVLGATLGSAATLLEGP